MKQILLTDQQIESFKDLLDVTLKVGGLQTLTKVVELLNILMTAREVTYETQQKTE